MIAVTGTNGKSSTVWYAKQMAEQVGLNVFSGGNFGCALSEMVMDTLNHNIHYDLAIVEVSSYQLEWSQDSSTQLSEHLKSNARSPRKTQNTG